MDDEIEDEYDVSCPECGHSPVRSRQCSNLGCEDGWIDRYDEDPLWYDEDDPEMCAECWGSGVERWCPKCGFDLQRPRRTQLAPDAGDSAASSGIVHASALSTSQAESAQSQRG